MKNLKILSVMLLFFFACMSPAKIAEKQAKQCAECAKMFPVPLPIVKIIKIDSSHTDTIFEDIGEVIVVDTTVCPPSDSERVIVTQLPCNCPKSPKIVTTKYEKTIETVTIRDSSESYLQHLEIRKLKDLNIQTVEKSRFLMLLAFGAMGFSALLLMLLGRKEKKTTPSVRF